MKIRCPQCLRISEIPHVDHGRIAVCACKATFRIDDSTVVEEFSLPDLPPPESIGRYAVLIPYPYAAEGHQDDNARLLAQTGAARIVPNAECSPAVFRGILAEFLDDPEEFREAGKGALAMAQPKAAANVIEFIEKSLKTARSKA